MWKYAPNIETDEKLTTSCGLKIKRTVAVVLLAATLSFAPAGFSADMASHEDPIHVELKTALNAETSQYGDPFEAVTTESYRFDGHEVPAGTVFKGQVKAARPSWSLAMPGYVELDVREAVFPDGSSFTFGTEKGLEADKLRHPDAVTPKKVVKSALPFSAISLADGLPLKLATNMSTWQILPISLVARMALGAALETGQSEKKWHAKRGHQGPTRLGHGMLRGTGATGMYYLLKPGPTPDLSSGKTIPLHFEENDIHSLFSASHTAAPKAAGQLQALPQVKEASADARTQAE